MLAATTTAFLFVAPLAASAGVRATLLLLSAIALAAGGLAGLRPRLEGLPRGVIGTYAAWAAFALFSLAWSVRPEYTMGELRAEIVYGSLAFGVFLLAASDPHLWRRWWIALMAGSLLVWLAHGLQLAGLRLSRHPLDGGPGPFSTHLVLIAPLLLALVAPPPFGVRRSAAGFGLATLLLLGAAWSSGNRIVWAAFVAACLGALVAVRRSRRGDSPRGRKLRIVVALAGAAMMLAFAASVLDRNERFHRGDPTAASLERDVRPRLWVEALEQVRQAPWIGHGFGREIRAEAFLPHTPREVEHPPLRHAHNTYLDLAVELGVVGLVLWLAVVAAIAREYWRYLSVAELAPLGAMGLALIAGYAVKNLTDDFFFRHNALVFWAINGILLGLGRAARAAR